MKKTGKINWDLPLDQIGRNLKLAREAGGKTTKECSQLLGIPTSRLRNYEDGKFIPSLPELESLSFFYKIPLSALLDPELLPAYIHNPDSEQLRQLLKIRRQIIATKLQLAHEESGMTLKELSQKTSLPASRIKKYLNGELSIPIGDLSALAKLLDCELDDFLDKDSPVGIWQENQQNYLILSSLPDEARDLLLVEENQSYFSFVNKVKEIGAEKFASLSEAIQIILNNFQQNQ